MEKRQEIQDLRLRGWTYQAIGDKCHISRQRVHQLLTGYKPILTIGYKKRKNDRKQEWQKGKGREKYSKLQRETNGRLKVIVLTHYGKGKLKCTHCGFSDIRALSIDHIAGKGFQHRQKSKTGSSFYRWLIHNGYPEGYQTLCMNCQWIKRVENKEYKMPVNFPQFSQNPLDKTTESVL